jgi:putative ABC transport system permease protein
LTVGTIRSEAAGDLRTLTATGADGGIRRTLTAATAASLAAGGVLLGVVGAYLGLMGAYLHHLDRLGGAPIGNLVAAVVGVPILSYAVGWCVSGREPEAFARQALD